MFGWHIAKNGSFKKSAAEAAEYIRGLGLQPCVQVFACGPRTSSVIIASEPLGVPAVIHGAYIDNPWSRGVVAPIVNELRLAQIVGANGVVVHLAQKAHHEDELGVVIKAMDVASDQGAQGIIWLEINTAKPSADTFETVESLTWLFEHIAEMQAEGSRIRYGLCVDTAHLWSCGMSFARYDEARSWLERCAAMMVRLGFADEGRPRMMFHLNDSAKGFASGVDNHAEFGTGFIWQGMAVRNTGFYAVVEFAVEHGLVVILERKTSRPTAELELIASLLR
jgi:endonuclease IV